jgi:Flp pilus assembly protein TadG
VAFPADRRGAAAAEFAMVGAVLGFILMNVVDVGMYVYEKMEVQNAAQTASEAVLANCEANAPDVTANCKSLSAYVSTAVHGTSLGANVSAGATTEKWQCDVSGALSDPDSGSTISGTAPGCGGTTVAGDYVTTSATYTYHPVFGHLSVVSLLSSAITGSATIRVA